MKYQGKQMDEFNTIVASAASTTETGGSYGSLGFWQAVLTSDDGSYSLATVDNCLAGNAVEGVIEPITEEKALKLISGELRYG